MSFSLSVYLQEENRLSRVREEQESLLARARLQISSEYAAILDSSSRSLARAEWRSRRLNPSSAEKRRKILLLESNENEVSKHRFAEVDHEDIIQSSSLSLFPSTVEDSEISIVIQGDVVQSCSSSSDVATDIGFRPEEKEVSPTSTTSDLSDVEPLVIETIEPLSDRVHLSERDEPPLPTNIDDSKLLQYRRRDDFRYAHYFVVFMILFPHFPLSLSWV